MSMTHVNTRERHENKNTRFWARIVVLNTKRGNFVVFSVAIKAIEAAQFLSVTTKNKFYKKASKPVPRFFGHPLW